MDRRRSPARPPEQVAGAVPRPIPTGRDRDLATWRRSRTVTEAGCAAPLQLGTGRAVQRWAPVTDRCTVPYCVDAAGAPSARSCTRPGVLGVRCAARPMRYSNGLHAPPAQPHRCRTGTRRRRVGSLPLLRLLTAI